MTTQSTDPAHDASDTACQLLSLFFFLRHFGPEYIGPEHRPKLDEVAMHVRNVGDLGHRLAEGMLEPIDDLNSQLVAATTFAEPTEVAS